jgi:predicted Zn-dependent protease
MKRRGSATGWLVGLLGLICALGSGCSKAKPKPPLPPVASASHIACDGGETRDPPHQEARPAMQALRAKDFDTAEHLFDGLLGKYPESASLRVWHGDALLGQNTDGSVASALTSYAEARALDALGCKLRERERYFLAIGVADADLRQKHPEPALVELEQAAHEWPDSAEVAYHRARAECLLGKPDECFNDLRGALDHAHSRQRVRFSRSHHSLDDLLQRAAKQVEFDDLRKEPRYRGLIGSSATDDAGTATP